jgi:glycosyltransferase involved in cell wall biosynthesis
MPGLSIIVPTKNEATAPRVINELYSKLGKDIEIIIVDKSEPKLREPLYATGAKIIEQKSKGYTAALMEGFLAAHGDIISTIDPDGTYSVDDFKKVVETLEIGDADFISGDRSSNKDAIGSYLRFGNKFLTFLFNTLYKQRMHDALSGSFVMRRSAFDSIRSVKPGSNRAGTLFFEAALALHGQRIKEIPITYTERQGSKPQVTKSKPLLGIKIAFYTLKMRITGAK